MLQTGRYFVTTNTDHVFTETNSDEIRVYRNLKEAFDSVRRYLRYFLLAEDCTLNIAEGEDLIEFITNPKVEFITLYYTKNERNDIESAGYEELVVQISRSIPVYTLADGKEVYDERSPLEIHYSNKLHECREMLFRTLKEVADSNEDGLGRSCADSFLAGLIDDVEKFQEVYIFGTEEEAQEFFKTLHV